VTRNQESMLGSLLVIVVASLLWGCSDQKYPWGRDTMDSFGDGRFQVVRGPTRLFLYDWEKHDSVVSYVKTWTSTAEFVFLVDGKGNCWKVNYKTGVATSFDGSDIVSTSDRMVFDSLLKRSERGTTAGNKGDDGGQRGRP
jgi:hypothetical protein